MTSPIPLPSHGKISLENWGIPITRKVNEFDTAINSLWTPYTPTWSSLTGTQPTVGNATIQGRWRYLGSLGIIIAEYYIVDGSTTSEGTGIYAISVPVTASSNSQLYSTGTAMLINAGLNEYGFISRFVDANRIRFYTGATDWSATTPFTFDTGDSMRGQIIYEPA